MSYILDALRKSDQLRQRNAAPTLLLGQATAAAPKQPALLPYGVLALALLGAGIAIGWLRPWQPEPEPVAPPARSAIAPAPERSPVSAAQPGAAPTPERPAQNAAPGAQAGPAAAPARGAAELRSGTLRAPPQATAEAPKKAAMPAPEPARSSNAAALAPAVMAMAELPLGIQQELPSMAVSVHAYSSKPAERLVGINGRLLREGDEVAPGLSLVQITPAGMVLSYKGYHFRRGVH